MNILPSELAVIPAARLPIQTLTYPNRFTVPYSTEFLLAVSSRLSNRVRELGVLAHRAVSGVFQRLPRPMHPTNTVHNRQTFPTLLAAGRIYAVSESFGAMSAKSLAARSKVRMRRNVKALHLGNAESESSNAM